MSELVRLRGKIYFTKYILCTVQPFLMLCMALNQVVLVVRNCTSCSALYERKSVTQVPTGSTSFSVANHSSVHHHLQNISRSSFLLSSSKSTFKPINSSLFKVRTLFVSGLPMDTKPRELYLLFRAYEVFP